MPMPVEQFRQMAQTPELTRTEQNQCSLTETAQTLCRGVYVTWSLHNEPQKIVQLFAKKMLENGQFPQNTKVYTKVTLSSWEKGKEMYEVQRKDVDEPSLVFSRTAAGVEEKVIGVLDPNDDCLLGNILLDSCNFPYYQQIPPPMGTQIVDSLRTCIQSSLRYLPDVQGVEWRYDDLGQFSKIEIEFALKELAAKGFSVDIQPTYFQVYTCDWAQPFLRAHQSLSARVPQGAAVPEDASSKMETFSLQNELIAWKKTEEKIPLPRPSLSVSDALKQISHDLIIVATEGSLERRYAFDIAEMASDEQLKLKSELESLGYSVSLDRPFIHYCLPFWKPIHRIGDAWMQYLYIDLPS